MATRQYIGARYVPKFANPIQWNINNSYEALTIVSALNNSYTSKKPVPPGVQITNEDYWAVTGNYNSQIEEYRQEVKNTRKRHIIYIGDSYAEGYSPDGNVTPWPTYCNNIIGRFLAYSVVSVSGGAGFLGNEYQRETFLSLLQKITPSVPDKDAITDIVVGGCVNDTNGTPDHLPAALSAFNAFASTIYKNAVIWLMPFGRTTNVNTNNTIITMLPYWSNSPVQGFNYVANSPLILHFDYLFSSDGQHPNELGQLTIGGKVANALLGGSITVADYSTATITDGYGYFNTPSIEVYMQNEIVNIYKFDNAGYIFRDPVSLTFDDEFSLKLGSINSPTLHGNAFDSKTIGVYVRDNDGTYYPGTFQVKLTNKDLILTGRIIKGNSYLTSNVTAIDMAQFALTLNAYNC